MLDGSSVKFFDENTFPLACRELRSALTSEGAWRVCRRAEGPPSPYNSTSDIFGLPDLARGEQCTSSRVPRLSE